MRRQKVTWPALGAVALSLCLLASLSPRLLVSLSVCHGQEEEKVPGFRRLLLSPDQLEDELKRVKEGVLVRLPLAEFDALVQKATQAKTRKEPPRLLEAHYHATLKEESLVGEGQWNLIHTASAAGLLKLEPFNLALRQARFENGDALIADFDGKGPALLVETAGERTVSLDWSARAEASREGLQFHLEIPPCPVMLFELDVPANRGVIVLNDGVVLSGPYEAESSGLRRWRIVWGGRRVDRRVDFRILPADRFDSSAERTSLPLVRQKTIQKLSPEGLDATFELTLDGLAQGVRELICECDAELRLRDVTGPGLESWSLQNGTSDKPSRFTIRLSDAIRGGTWQIFCLAPLHHLTSPSSKGRTEWHSPSLRLVNGVPRGETLTISFDPALRVEGWDAGSFRLTTSELDRTTGAQVLTLVGGGLGPPRRPTAALQVHGVEYRTHQLTWLHCDASGIALTVQIGWDVSLGQLFQLPVLLPTDWRVEKVEMNPPASLRDWRVHTVGGKSTLFVDLARPLAPRSHEDSEGSAQSQTRIPIVTVQLRPGWPGPHTEKKIPMPDAVPLGACFREGAVALGCDEQLFHIDVNTSMERSPPEGEGSWGTQIPEYYYRYNLSSPSDKFALTGEVQIHALPPRLRAKAESEVFVASGRAAVETHLTLEAEVGSPESVELWLSASEGGTWLWRNEAARSGDETVHNRIYRSERLYQVDIAATVLAYGMQNPIQAALLLAARPSGERWRLTLARPLRARETLRLVAQRYLEPHGNRWDVPLPIVLNADRMEGEVSLHLAAADIFHVRTFGLRETSSYSEKKATPRRRFRYGQGEVALSLSGQLSTADHSPKPAIERARLVTYAGEAGATTHLFSFHVCNWNQNTLSLSLPPGSRPLAVQIDGYWLPELLPDATPTASSRFVSEQNSTRRIELALPVPVLEENVRQNTVHRFEIVYTSLRTSRWPWEILDAPVPDLPVAPLALQRIWRLPPKWTPLDSGHYQSLPGTEGETNLSALPHRLDELFRLPGSWTRWNPLLEDRQGGAREAFDRAVQELHARFPEEKLSLRESVRNLAFVSLKDRYVLLIDALAFREAGIGPETVMALHRLSPADTIQPWAEFGMIAVSTGSTILLTTTTGRGACLHEPLSEEMEKALAMAASRGQDPSGRFQTALDWLSAELPSDWKTNQTPTFDFVREHAGWSEWEPVAGADKDRMVVVRRDVVTATGLVFVFLLCLILWLIRSRSVRSRLVIFLLALGLFGLGVFWLPESLRELAWWPLFAGCTCAVFWYFRTVWHTIRKPHSTVQKQTLPVPAASVAGLLTLCILCWPGRAAAPALATVYLIPSPANTPEKQSVLVPANLLDRLKLLARPTPLSFEGMKSVLLDSSYEGQLVEDGNQIEFVASFSAYSLTDEASTLRIPLSEIQLVGEVFLDGMRADLQTLEEPQTGYAINVRGRGRHKVELRFRSPVVGTVEDRNILFTIPPLLRSSLSWRVGSGISEPRILVKYGAQWTVRDPAGERLEADLGSLPRPVHLHWYHPGPAVQLTYQAAYLWDLGLENNELTAWLRYRVDRGAVNKLEVELPADLEISAATAQRSGQASLPPWLARFQLRDWYVKRTGDRRLLYLELPYPIGGEFQVTLNLLPRSPLTSRTELPLPTPYRVMESGPHYLAYRTHPGLLAQRDTSQFLTRISETEFASDWSGVPQLEANFSIVAYRITPNQAPKLSLLLQHVPSVVQTEVDLTVRTGQQVTEVQGVAEVKAGNKGLMAIEWVLPSTHCTIASVSGDEVRTWKQNGNRLFVWLNRMTETTRIRISGWIPAIQQGERFQLAMDGLRPDLPGKLHTRLHLIVHGDPATVSVKTQNLQKANTEGRTREEISDFETWDSSYHLDCEVQSTRKVAVRVLTLVEVSERELRFTATVDYTIRYGELRHIQLRLRHWDEDKVEVKAEQATVWPEPRRSSGERSWLLPLPPGVRKRYQVTLRGSIPLDKAAEGVLMPEVLVQGVDQSQYFLALAGSEVSSQVKGALQPLRTPAKELQPYWPEAAQRLEHNVGQAWRVLNTEWQLKLWPHARLLESSPIRVFLLENSALVVDGRRWMHEAIFWLSHEANSDLHLDFPVPARLLGAAVDGIPVTPLQSRPTRVWLPLPNRRGVRHIRLQWFYDEPEPLERPNLMPLQIEGASQGTILWTVMIPPGWEMAHGTPSTSLGDGPTRVATLALHHTEIQLLINQVLAKQFRDSTSVKERNDSQQRFDAYCRLARNSLDVGAGRNGAIGPEGKNLSRWLTTLLDANRSFQSENGEHKDADTETGRQRDKETFSEEDVSLSSCQLASLSEKRGRPLSWRSSPDSKPLVLELTTRESQRTQQALIGSGEWLGGLIVVWAISFWPSLLARLRLFWPEQIALIGGLGWYVAGLTSVVLALLLAAVCGRSFLFGRALHHLVRKRRKQVSTMTPGSGVIS